MFGIKNKFGFGCMRMKMDGDHVDYDEFTKMVDMFIERGFNYFDTAHGYLNGQSEVAIRECLTSRYPREAYMLTNKLSNPHFNSQEEIRPLFEKQLEICGVEYFDFYLMHAQESKNYEKYKACKAYETAFELKKEGKVRHVGISFHDTAKVLDRILTEYPEIEVVQLQFNYFDYDDVSVQSKKCYDVCVKHGKPVFVMEPVKGGKLVELPEEAQKVFDELGGGSNASYAIRFAASHENVIAVLSGMGNVAMVDDNTSYMRNFVPLTEKESAAVDKVREILKKQNVIQCTACHYCTENCPVGIPIPEFFACLNAKRQFNNWNSDFYFETHSNSGKKPTDCINCGTCEGVCPQHLPIRRLLRDVAHAFED